MSLKIIAVGDKTDHGGTVISGSPAHDSVSTRGSLERNGGKPRCIQGGELDHAIPLVRSRHFVRNHMMSTW
jgi:uncharacterized Zn-binding protein involved in type VI secretion